MNALTKPSRSATLSDRLTLVYFGGRVEIAFLLKSKNYYITSLFLIPICLKKKNKKIEF